MSKKSSVPQPRTSSRRQSANAVLRDVNAAAAQLPLPASDAILHSEMLIKCIRDSIESAHGFIAFSEYMSSVLMQPGLGYYSAGSQKFGAAGDFITAPETSQLFALCLARQCQQVLNAYPAEVTTTILEIGAGTGRLAYELLLELEAMHCLPQRYWILEPSADLQALQQQSIANHAPQLLERVTWLVELPHNEVCGVIIGNEVLDVLPVDLFEIQQGELVERGVGWHEGRFQWRQRAAKEPLKNAVLELGLSFDEAYQSEVSLSLPAWVTSVGDSLQSGLLLLIDYGYARREYYHPQRNRGSLMCHYRHRAHEEPFVYPGLQDITAHVDFTAVAEAAVAANMHVAGYNTQGQFLLSCGIDVIANNLQQGEGDNAASLALSQQIKQLTLPSEMGEIFKVIGLTRDFDENLMGFSLFDMRGKL